MEPCVKEGDFISINSDTGRGLPRQSVETQAAGLSGDFSELMKLPINIPSTVRTNADTPHDAAVARNF